MRIVDICGCCGRPFAYESTLAEHVPTGHGPAGIEPLCERCFTSMNEKAPAARREPMPPEGTWLD